jgi:hypothetical protein
MENRSKHYGDIKLWVDKVINSCETMEQIRTADRLINNFNKQLERKCVATYWRDHYYTIIAPLKFSLEEQRDKLFDKKLK